MKRITLLIILSLTILVTWCSRGWSKKTDITSVKFNVEACNKYFKLMDCVLDNDTDVSYTEEQREDIRKEVKSIQEQWIQLDDEILAEACQDELAKFESSSEAFSKIGCPLE